MNKQDARQFLPLGAMASRLGIQAKDLREAAATGNVPSVRVGQRGLLFDPGAVYGALLARSRACGKGEGRAVPRREERR